MMVGVGGFSERTFSFGMDSVFFHEAGDAVEAQVFPALVSQLGKDAGAAVVSFVPEVDQADMVQERGIFLGPGREGSLLPGVEPAAGDFQDAAHETDGEVGLLRLDQPDWFGFSRAKKAAAFFRKSLSMRRVLTSRRRRRSSSFSAEVKAPGGPDPSSIRACLIHRLNVLSGIPRFSATLMADSWLSRANRTASAFSSLLYRLLFLGMWTPFRGILYPPYLVVHRIG